VNLRIGPLAGGLLGAFAAAFVLQAFEMGQDNDRTRRRRPRAGRRLRYQVVPLAGDDLHVMATSHPLLHPSGVSLKIACERPAIVTVSVRAASARRSKPFWVADAGWPLKG
jgi:hypothetical protein